MTPHENHIREAERVAPDLARVERVDAPAPSAMRIYAMIMRYWYLLRSSVPRLLELIYWPTVQMILWGLITQFLTTNSSYVAQAAGVLIAAVLLWDIFFRSEIGLAISFMEEMYSRNLGHLFVSPLRPFELLISMMAMSLLRVVIGVIPAMLLAIVLYEYNIFTLGLPLIGFFVNLMAMGWVLGLVVVGILVRSGLGAESLAWLLVFAMAPISAIYYPVWTLPEFLQAVALFVPAAHVFEGMRTLIVDGVFDAGEMLRATALNVVYLLLAAAFCLWMIRQARVTGRLLQSGE